MIHRLTDKMGFLHAEKAHTLTELLLGGVIVIALFASVFGAFVITNNIYVYSAANYHLQRNADGIMARIVRGAKEQTGTYSLRSARSFTLPAVTPTGSELRFVSTDGNTRRYFLNNNTIVYESPAQSPNQKVIYTPPANSTIILRFWEAGGYIDQQLVGIYLSVSQQLGNRTAFGSVTTYVNLRNIPK